MNQRSSFTRIKDPRREKIIRTRRNDDERSHGDEPPTRRSSAERPNSTHVASYSKFKDTYTEKPRSNSRDSQGSLIFWSQGPNKTQSKFPKSSSGEISPGRVSRTDTIRNDTSGRLNYFSHYSRGFNMRDRDYAAKRSGLIDNNHIIDETRLKNYLHRLLRDEDKERQASLIRQLKIVFEHPENYKVILGNKDVIISTFEDFVQLGLNSELKHEFICAVGTLGSVLGSKAKSLLDWEFSVISTSKCDDLRILMLKSQLEMLKIDAEKQNMTELMPFLMSKLQSSLEVADVPDLLIAIVNVIFEIAHGYPVVFSKHFSDTVDILIGWHIDATQQQSVIEFTSNALIGFQQFWISDINFTVTLLGQFLEDMESYAEGLPKVKSPPKKSVKYLKELAQSKLNSSKNSDSPPCSPEENIIKIKSLIKVLITVLKSIEDLIAPDETGPITWKFVTDMLKNFLKYVKVAVACNYYCDLMTSANECLELILKLAQTHSKDALSELMSYMDMLQSRSPNLFESHLMSILQVMIRFVRSIGAYLPVEFVTKLFTSSSLTRQLKFSPSTSIQKLLMELYHVVLAVKNVQVVEEFYTCIMTDIMEAHGVLFSGNDESKTDSLKIKNAEVVILLGICTLVEIGNIKHSLIRMFALKPSFFDLMISELKPTLPELATRYPALQSSILYILYSHCARHSHFVNNSALLNPNTASSSPITTSDQNSIVPDVLSPSTTSGHLEKVVKLLIELLDGQHHSYDSRLLASRWLTEIIESIQPHILEQLMEKDVFPEALGAVLNAGFKYEAAICKSCCKSMKIFLKSSAFVLPQSTLQRCYDLIILKMGCHDPDLQSQFASLLPLLPIDVFLMTSSVNISKYDSVYAGAKDSELSPKVCMSISDVWNVYRNYMSRPNVGNFFSHHFRAVTSFVLQGKEPMDKKWLLRMFHSCPPPERMNKVDSVFSSLVHSSFGALWFWAMWEVAESCVVSKLRTPLGKPQETFMAIEAALKSSAKIGKNAEDAFYSGSKNTILFRVNLLLSLLEQLEKLMYNAYEGCAVSLPSPPKNVRTFFRTNKSTCHEWLSRVRFTTVAVALKAGCPAVAVRHGFEHLQELKNSGNVQGPEFENILYSVVRALIQLCCPEAVLGLYIWCKEKIGRKFTWIKASVDCAAGRFENAAHEYLCILQSLSECLSPQKASKQFDQNKNTEKSSIVNGIDDALNKLNINEKPAVDVQLHLFLLNQVVDCYTNVQSWPEAIKWAEFLEKVKVSQNGINVQKTWNSNSVAYLKCLSSFEESSLLYSKKELSSFSNDMTKNTDFSGTSWNTDEEFSKSLRMLMSVALDFNTKNRSDNLNEFKEKMNDVQVELLKLMKLSTLNWPPHMDPKHIGLYVSTSIFQTAKMIPTIYLREKTKLDPTDCYSSTLGFLLTWENMWHSLTPSFPSILKESYFNLVMTTVRLARKQQNFKMCYNLLSKSLNQLSKTDWYVDTGFNNMSEDFHEMVSLKNMLQHTFNWKPSIRLLRIQREGAKLLRCLGDNENCSDVLLHSIYSVASLQKDKKSFVPSQLSELNSRSMLNLVKYIQQDAKMANVLSQENSSVPKEANWSILLFNCINDLKHSEEISEMNRNFISELEQEKVVSDSDYLIGQLLQLSIYQCPSLAKSWCSFASWCYGWGRKVVNTSCGSMNMLPEEKAKILSLVPSASKDDIDSLINAVINLHTSSGEWENQEMDYSENSVGEIKYQLITCCPFLLKIESSDTVVDSILEVWKNLTRRAYSYYRMAAVSYLQYLQLNGKVTNRDKCEDDNVTATLRLLRLVVKHALELRDVLEEGVANTPTAPWRGIIPQLFSRLSHPELYVRQSISDLLCRVAQAAPHLIVFPAVVGSLTLKAGPQLQEDTGLFRVYLPDSSEDPTESPADGSQGSNHEDLQPSEALLSEENDSEEDRQKTAVMQNCFTALVETLGSQDEKTISEAKTLIHELHRITLLWDELWLGTLNMHQSEVNRRFLNLEKEICKVMNNTYLSKEEKKEIIKEKHNVYAKPTLFLLEQLQTITSQPAETPHEQWFQKTFEKHIENSVNKLKNPSDPSRPQESWAVFKQLYQLLQKNVQLPTRAHLNMGYISPVLASLKTTVIPMPGINKSSGLVTIQAVHHVVSVLPTKTKPKKLAFIGSDGRRYTYLFKGLEDLHLDERIMQFLSIVNNMFSKSKRYAKEVYYARHYSVTPLGPRSGLIQWVDGATPLFGLYKRWQQREAASATTKGQNSSTVGAVLRPSEIYYNKLTPLLKEKNLNCLDNRKEWPLTVMLEVLKQLMEETPDNLLAKELWCSSSSALEWWNVTQTYNHSTAVMSVIGYIIGLGDRHLDNVLIDLSTGEVVHIDYNVCFEKGKNLRVPEKVPFRLTPNIVTALGLTGIEGVFRTSCEHVLKVLRRGRETLLTLLEAFVYDPLVDWTPGNEGGYTGAVYGGRQAWATEAKQTRQSMELDIAFCMFAIRIAEMKGEWAKNRDELTAAFPKLEKLLQDWKNAQLQLQQAETELQDACQEKALLEEALANPSHNLYTVPKRYDETTIVKTTVNATKEAVTEKLNECKKWHTVHCESLVTVCGAELGNWRSDVSGDQNNDTLTVTSVIEFLQSAGQGQLVQQCEQSENELGSALQQRRLTMRNCIECLTTYATIVLQFGPGYKEQNRCFKWHQWLESLLSDFTSLKCIEILADFRNNYIRETPDAIQCAISLNMQFQNVMSEINTKVFSIEGRMRIEGLDDKTALAACVEETKRAVVHFLSDVDKPSHLAFLCVLCENLCTIRKQLFMMESAAGASGDRLVDLTLWNGDWFLDEMHSACGNVAQYIQLLLESHVVESPELEPGLQGVKFSHFLFSALEDLSLHYQNIILPEAIQTALEPSVMEMVAKLDRIIARCGVPLDKLIADLNSNITNVILKTEVTENRASDTVKKLRNEFESLMQRTEPGNQRTGLNQGQMLLMGFNGLFTKVDSDLDALLAYLDKLLVPACWQKLDIYRDTVALAPSVHHPSARPILKDIYFVRKLLAMQQSFHACHNFAASLYISTRVGLREREVILIPDHQLIKPVKQFTADYVLNLVLGLPSQTIGFALCLMIKHLGYDLTAEIELRDVGVENKVPLEEILTKTYKSCITDNFLEAQLPHMGTLLTAFNAAWIKEDLAKRMEQYLVVARNSQTRIQLQFARFQWLNEDLLVQGNIGPLQIPSFPSRATVMSEIRKAVSTLLTYDCVVSSAHERYRNISSSIEQRLKWAAGANSSLATVQVEFKQAIASKTAIISNSTQLSRDLVNICNAILHFEALRTRTTEAVSSDNTFLALINRCKETCELAESCQSEISSIEEHLISLKPLDKEGVTKDWLTAVIKKVSQSLTACREKLEHQKSVTTVCWESLHLQVVHVHDLISLHHKLMSEVRHILRNLAKHEEIGLGSECKSEGQIHGYMALYKEFSEKISSIVSTLAEAQEMELSSLSTIENELPVLSVSAFEVYNQLIELAGPLGSRKNGILELDISKQTNHSKKSFLNVPHDSSAMHSPGIRPKTPLRCGTPKKLSVTRDPRTGKAVQERNTYATNVWKRVKMKLDGRDPEPNKKCSISEQVDYVIKEATNLENLAVLYEGWTPWV